MAETVHRWFLFRRFNGEGDWVPAGYYCPDCDQWTDLDGRGIEVPHYRWRDSVTGKELPDGPRSALAAGGSDARR